MNQEELARELQRHLRAIVVAVIRLFEQQHGVTLDVDIHVTARTKPTP